MEPVSESYLLDVCWQRWRLTPKRATRDEWYGPCPVCGGKDRFRIFQEDGGYWCRKQEGTCRMKGWLDDDKQKEFKPDPNWKENQRKREQAERDLRLTLVQRWQASYRANYWKGWHSALTQENRAWFHARGVTDEIINKYGFGYCAEKRLEDGTVLPAYTMPARSPLDWSVVNVHFRLVGREKDKYRYDFLKDDLTKTGEALPAAPFYCEPHGEHNEAIVVEGTFKAVSVYEILRRTIQVIGLPSAAPSPHLFEEIRDNYATRWIWLDPGAEEAALRAASFFDYEFTRCISTPWKPDDAILHHSLGEPSVRAWMKQSRIISHPKTEATKK